MTRARSIWAIIAIGLVAMATSTSAVAKVKAHKPRTHPFTGTLEVTAVKSQKGLPPAPGSSTVNTGTVTSKQWGDGTLNATAIFDNAFAPGAIPIHGHGSFTFKRGTLKFTFTMLGTWQQPPVFMGGNARVTGGTGKFKKAKGSFTFQGRSALILSPASCTLAGKLSY